MSSGNDPAFPVEVTHKTDGTICGVQTGSRQGWEMGLTKRELFAAVAMHAFLVNPRNIGAMEFAQLAVDHADDLLAALAKKGGAL